MEGKNKIRKILVVTPIQLWDSNKMFFVRLHESSWYAGCREHIPLDKIIYIESPKVKPYSICTIDEKEAEILSEAPDWANGVILGCSGEERVRKERGKKNLLEKVGSKILKFCPTVEVVKNWQAYNYVLLDNQTYLDICFSSHHVEYLGKKWIHKKLGRVKDLMDKPTEYIYTKKSLSDILGEGSQ